MFERARVFVRGKMTRSRFVTQLRLGYLFASPRSSSMVSAKTS